MIPIGTNLRLKRIPKVTIALIVINTLLYIADFHEHEFIFSAFSHADFFHLFFNMVFLWSFGSYLEDKIGWKRFLFFYFISEAGSELLWEIMDGRPSIGASGAISGVMGIYLMRCHYAKIKTIIDPIGLFFIKVNLNAKWMLGIFFLRDIYNAFYTDDLVAHWAHIGGFLTGLIIGKISKYGVEARKEHLYERASELVEQRWGLADAEKDLLEALKIEPENPEIFLQFARLYSDLSDEREKGKEHYLNAARLYYLKGKDKSKAGEAFLEYLMRHDDIQSPELHLKYASTLSNTGNYDSASRILQPLIYGDNLQGATGEKALINFIRYSSKADLKELTEEAYKKLKEIFPESHYIMEAEALLSETKAKSIQLLKSSDVKTGLNIREKIDDITSEPIFWVVWIISITVTIKFGEWFGFEERTFLFLLALSIVLSFSLTSIVRGIGSFAGAIYNPTSNKTDKEGLREFNVSVYFKKAALCEREGKFDEAVEYYNAVINEDEKHLEARFRLARLYQKNLNQHDMAIEEYKNLLKITPKEHPYWREANESIKALYQFRRQDTSIHP